MAILTIAIVGLLIVMSIIGYPRWRAFQRNKIASKPFPKEWRKLLQNKIPYYRLLPADLQLILKGHIQVFLAEKEFIGCEGLVVNDGMRVIIAAQACMLLMNKHEEIFPNTKTIYLYPSQFVVERVQANADGIKEEQAKVLQGESWSFGQVVLSWSDSLQGAVHPFDGHNVVMHEFAHQIDQASGAVNGAPPLPKTMSGKQWKEVLTTAYQSLNYRMSHNMACVIDRYAATNEGEFFAVVTECFFEKPHELFAEYPALYEQFKRFYALDPLLWLQEKH